MEHHAPEHSRSHKSPLINSGGRIHLTMRHTPIHRTNEIEAPREDPANQAWKMST
jgi:hypothetical protein